jgi:hypothetical protein
MAVKVVRQDAAWWYQHLLGVLPLKQLHMVLRWLGLIDAFIALSICTATNADAQLALSVPLVLLWEVCEGCNLVVLLNDDSTVHTCKLHTLFRYYCSCSIGVALAVLLCSSIRSNCFGGMCCFTHNLGCSKGFPAS